MEKFPISSTSTSNVLSSSSASNSMAANNDSNNNHNSQYCFSIYKPPNYCYQYPLQMQTLLHQHQGLVQFPAGAGGQSFSVPGNFAVAVGGQNGSVKLGVANPQSNVVSMSKEQEKRLFDAWMTKAARSKRKLARQRSLTLSRSTSTSSSNSNSNSNPNYSSTTTGISTINRDLYNFCTPDKKRLRALLKKELKNSDVGSLGRIVLPKREAEEKLPILSDKEGIQVLIRDVYSNKEWSLRYKYWSNNKSRMYVLENTGDFVKQNGLEIGDSVTLYEDECKNLFVSFKKRERAEPSEASNKQLPALSNQNTNDNNSPTSDDTDYSSDKTDQETDYDNLYANFAHDELTRDEDEAFLALLIQQLNHKEQQLEANSLVTCGRWEESAKCDAPSHNYNNDAVTGQETANKSPPPLKIEAADDHLDDCYGSLGTLPEIDRYRYYSYATLFDRIMSDKS
ncbi:B3 domain-containing transcription factor LEC2 [Morus notabilis]|uniref:B3 domain-containing transcription factor LEC2 n=1 Tax=Morus notabilis TaxID=981085 RepID=UPI000CED5551|nr:B3 domain-containing transcription factor LEC2 [Morus notabilis]